MGGWGRAVGGWGGGGGDGRAASPTPPSTTPLQLVRLEYDIGSHSFALELPTAATTYVSAPPTPSLVSGSVSPLPDLTPLSHGYIAKLADFGTADTRPEGIGAPLRPHHFTTLENSPPEYLIDGDACTQGFGADTWALGLCGLHLLTGCAPYEEVMEGVVCPPPLAAALRAIWVGEAESMTSLPASSQPQRRGKRGAAAAAVVAPLPPTHTYRVVGAVIAEGDESAARLLADTLYRVLVLKGWEGAAAPASADVVQLIGGGNAGAAGGYAQTNPVWALLHSALLGNTSGTPSSSSTTPVEKTGGGGAVAGGGRAGNSRASSTAPPPPPPNAHPSSPPPPPLISAAECAATAAAYARDVAVFSVARGSSPLMVRARRRLRALAGAEGEGLRTLVLDRLLSLHPSSRVSMKAALLSAAFLPLRVGEGGGAGGVQRPRGGGSDELTVAFPAFGAVSDDDVADV